MSIQTDDFSGSGPRDPRPVRVVGANPASPNEEAMERALRPKRLDDYVGQVKAREQLDIFIGAARKRSESLDHVLLFGPPGLGKTTLSHIIAAELGVNLRQTSGPVLEKPKDLAAILTGLERNDVLFIDEIHRLSPVVEEILYPALEDFQIDIMIGDGPAARSIKLDLQPFTLVGATTRAGMLTNPLRDRFGIVARLEFYTAEELSRIVVRSAGLLGVPIDGDGALELARRSRGTPRIANRLLRRVRDYADVKAEGRITVPVANLALAMLDVDPQGFDVMDRKLLEAIVHRFDGGPVGLDNVAAAIGEEPGTIEDVIEPYLIQQGYLQRTPRGRIATIAAYRHLGLAPPVRTGIDLFGMPPELCCSVGARRQRRGDRHAVGRFIQRRCADVQVAGVVPADQRQAGGGVQQAVDRRVVQLPDARRVERHAGGGAVEAVHHAAVRHQHHRLADVAFGDAQRGLDAARIEGGQRLAVAARGEFRIAALPAGGQVGPALGDLGVRHALETPEAAFAQAGIEFQRDAVERRDRLRGGPRAREIAADDHVGIFLREPMRRAARLLLPALVERNVQLALQAGLDVPGGLAVSYRDQARRFCMAHSGVLSIVHAPQTMGCFSASARLSMSTIGHTRWRRLTVSARGDTSSPSLAGFGLSAAAAASSALMAAAIWSTSMMPCDAGALPISDSTRSPTVCVMIRSPVALLLNLYIMIAQKKAAKESPGRDCRRSARRFARTARCVEGLISDCGGCAPLRPAR